MKKTFYILLALAVAGFFVWTLYNLYNQSKPKTEIYKTETPVITDIIKKSVATGSIVPRREVLIKPRISGVVEKIYAAPGQFIKSGALIAVIRIIPNMVTVNTAEASLDQARINMENTKNEFDRNANLFKEKLISQAEYNQFYFDYKRRQQEVEAAENNLQLLKEGSSKKIKAGNNRILSTVTGMLLDIPVREGSSVIESNTFNEGTTIASVADMNDMIFVGKIEESEVDKVKEGMKLILTIGAIEGKKFPAELTFIAPKGVDVEGAVQFEIKASIILPKNEFIRAGYSSTADIVLAKVQNVLAIPEKLLQFKNGKTYVEVEKNSQIFESREVITGLSDGLLIEIKKGLTKKDRIKIPGSSDDKTKK